LRRRLRFRPAAAGTVGTGGWLDLPPGGRLDLTVGG
jgi:hypothetical protein